MVSNAESNFKIKQNDSVGRYAVATKTLKAGDVLFEEYPFAVGPKTNSAAVCLECCAPIDGTEKGSKCGKCGWPLCESCKLNTTLPNHSGECEVFQQNKVKFYCLPQPGQVCLQFECITPLRYENLDNFYLRNFIYVFLHNFRRILLQKEKNPKRWENEVSKMEYHPEIRKNTDAYNTDNTNIVGYLRGPCKLKDRFTEELIQRVCGILEVNSFEAKTAKGHKVRCIYYNAAVLAHSCVPNTTHSILSSKDFKYVFLNF